MRLDANGNLGVNINAPTSTLHVSGTSNITGAATFGNAISVGNSNTFNFSTLNILNTNLYDSDPNVGIAYGTATANAVNTGQSYAWRQRATGNAIAGISSVTESIVRDGTWTERMRITSDGTLSITGNANIGNLNLTGNILDTTGPLSIVTTSNGNINLSPNGTGIVNVSTSLAANANITSSNGFFVSGNSALGYWLNVTGNNVGKLYYNAGAVKVEATDATSNVQIAANGTSRITVFANGLSTINGALSASGNVTGGNLIATNYIVRSVTTGVTAAGSTQGTATALTRDINIVNTVAPSANGVILPTAVSGMMLTIVNTTANTLQVYPASGAAIDALAANAAFSMVGNARIQFAAATGTLWYSI
jgi:hypothetical protein